MKILHVFPKSDPLISRHVAMLTEGMQQSADVSTADNASVFRQQLRERQPDIVHCHGCWHRFVAKAGGQARRQGARVVITLHGQLEPWVIRQNAQERLRVGASAGMKLGQSLLWQKEAVAKAYAVITFGKLERTNFSKLGWNSRIEEIRNAVTTNSISQKEMCAQTFAVYQKVMDSNTLEQMDDDTVSALAAILKVGITGDRRWLADTVVSHQIDYRRLLIYAEHENIRNYVDYGMRILQLTEPTVIDTAHISAYFPDQYTRPQPVSEVAGAYQGDEADYIVRIIRQLHRQPLLLHMVELTRELYRADVDEDRLAEMLDEKGLKNYAAQLMTVLGEQTLLDEGFMPLPPVDNRQTRQIRQLLTNHLKI